MRIWEADPLVMTVGTVCPASARPRRVFIGGESDLYDRKTYSLMDREHERQIKESVEPLRHVADMLSPDDKFKARSLFMSLLLLTRTCKHRDILHDMLHGTDEEIKADLRAIDRDYMCAFEIALSLDYDENYTSASGIKAVLRSKLKGGVDVPAGATGHHAASSEGPTVSDVQGCCAPVRWRLPHHDGLIQDADKHCMQQNSSFGSMGLCHRHYR